MAISSNVRVGRPLVKIDFANIDQFIKNGSAHPGIGVHHAFCWLFFC